MDDIPETYKDYCYKYGRKYSLEERAIWEHAKEVFHKQGAESRQPEINALKCCGSCGHWNYDENHCILENVKIDDPEENYCQLKNFIPRKK